MPGATTIFAATQIITMNRYQPEASHVAGRHGNGWANASPTSTAAHVVAVGCNQFVAAIGRAFRLAVSRRRRC